MLKMKKTNIIAAVLLAVLVMLTGCGQKTEPGSQTSHAAENTKGTEQEEQADRSGTSGSQIELSIAHIGALESPSNLAVEKFAQLVEERSGGTIKITNYPASQLGGDREILEGIVGGTVDMGIPGAGITAIYLPEYNIFDTPYIFESEEHMMNAAQGELGQELADKFLETTGVRVVTQNWKRGTRQSIFTKEVKDLNDFAGVKIRLPEVEAYLKAFELLGTKPTIVPFNETYSALQQGVVEGMECPLDWIYDNKFYEICKHLVITNHDYSVMTVLMNEQKWNSLTAEQQKIILEAAIEAGEYENQILAEKESEYLEKMKAAGVTVYEPDLEPFLEKVRPVLPEITSAWGEGLYEKVQSYKGSVK